jgi:hypothetical protein
VSRTDGSQGWRSDLKTRGTTVLGYRRERVEVRDVTLSGLTAGYEPHELAAVRAIREAGASAGEVQAIHELKALLDARILDADDVAALEHADEPQGQGAGADAGADQPAVEQERLL